MSDALPSDYVDRFGGLGRLLGQAALDRLASAHVAVVGVGGVGSWTVEALARSGVGALTLVDLDDVCVTNTNRQLPALADTVGRAKVAVLAERVAAISPGCRVAQVTEFFGAANADRLLAPRYDYVVDAIDRAATKAVLLAACRDRGLPCVTVGGAGGKSDATCVRTGDLGESGGDDLLRLVRRALRREHGWQGGEGVRFDVRAVWSSEAPKYPWADGMCRADPESGASLRMDCASGFGAAVWVTATFGMVAAGEVVQWIARRAD